MSMFFNEIAEANAAHLEAQGINSDMYRQRPFVSNERDEDDFNGLIEGTLYGLLAQCEDIRLAEKICKENDLQETDLLPLLIVAITSWSGGADTAHKAIKSASLMVYLAMNQIAEKQARKAMGL